MKQWNAHHFPKSGRRDRNSTGFYQSFVLSSSVDGFHLIDSSFDVQPHCAVVPIDEHLRHQTSGSPLVSKDGYRPYMMPVRYPSVEG